MRLYPDYTQVAGAGGEKDEQGEGGWEGEGVEGQGRKGRRLGTLPGREEKPSPGQTLGVGESQVGLQLIT